MRVLLTLQYLGTRYAGWQAQENALSVQQVVEEALASLCKQPVAVAGAGRTDAGVHAERQSAHFDLPLDIPIRGVVLGLNDLLPRDVRVVAAGEVPPDFHARFSAVSKTYRYQIWNDEIADVFRAPTHALVRAPLELERMHAAAEPLVGRHDFRAYTVADPEVTSTVRTLESLTIARDGAAILVHVTADGFLRYMVRRIVGQLIEIGRGKLDVPAAAAALEPGFAQARWTAPPEGLVLESVRY
ncbi:MAG: tRNA pseudouridine(38-40) synthase TruA [Thermoanaerobaculia bacterium]